MLKVELAPKGRDPDVAALCCGVSSRLFCISSAAFACCIIAIDHFSKRMDPILLTALELAFAGVFSLIFMVGTREPSPTLTGTAVLSLGFLVFLGCATGPLDLLEDS